MSVHKCCGGKRCQDTVQARTVTETAAGSDRISVAWSCVGLYQQPKMVNGQTIPPQTFPPTLLG